MNFKPQIVADEPGVVDRYERWLITPATAKALMANNIGNRYVRKSTIARYTRDMKAGKWRDLDAPITVRLDGRPIDGQHRLISIIDTGLTYRCWVHIVGNDVEPLDLRLDLATSRSVRDITGLPNTTISVSRALYAVVSNRRHPATVDTVLHIADVVAPELERLTTTRRQSLTTAYFRAAFCFSMWKHGEDAAEIAQQYSIVAHQDYGMPVWPAIGAMAKAMTQGISGTDDHLYVFMRTALSLEPGRRDKSAAYFKDWSASRESFARQVAEYVAVEKMGESE